MLATFLKGASAAKEIEFISSSIIRSTPQNITVTAPSNIQDGDLLVSVAYYTGSRTITSYPSGFTQIFASTNSGGSLYVATKTASGESGNYTFNSSSTQGSATISILVYRNAKEASPLVGSITRADSNTSTAASISPTATGVLIGIFGNKGTRTVVTSPSGMTQRAIQTGSAPSLALYDILPNPAGATGNKTLVWSGSDDNVGLLVQFYK
jgi:hypothetical protein